MVDIGFIFKYIAHLYIKICNINFSFDGIPVNVAAVIIFVVGVALSIPDSTVPILRQKTRPY